MATLADELLADLMESGSEGEEGVDQAPGIDTDLHRLGQHVNQENEDEEDEDEDKADEHISEARLREAAADGRSALADLETQEEAQAEVSMMNLSGVSDVRSVAGLIKSLKPVLEVSNPPSLSFQHHHPSLSLNDCVYKSIVLADLTCADLQKINQFQHLPPEKQTKNIGSIEDNPEYKLLTQANALSTQIDNEIILVHKFIRDHYSIRFPELENLIISPLLYAKTVAILANHPLDQMDHIINSSDNKVGQSLKQVLDGPSLMVVRVESTTTKGRLLSESELTTVLNACEMTLQLDQAKATLADYVQSRMNLFAPNLTVLVGPETAAALVNTAGGLAGLAKIPSCNIPSYGSKRQTFGLSTNASGIRRQGHLFHSPIIQGIPQDLRVQAMRIVAAKLVLCARVDTVHESQDGRTGEQLKQDCLDRLDKLTETAPNKGVRALPAPDDKPARKRGGRRARKAKEAVAMTELRKAQNRMAFGKEEQTVGYGTGDDTVGLGMIGQSNDGRVRATQVDQRTKAKLSKKNPGWGGTSTAGGLSSSLRGFGQGGAASVLKGHGLRPSGVGGGSGAGAGTSSVIAFTPFQGLELANPQFKAEQERKRKAEEDRYFKSGTFTQVGGGSSVVPAVKTDDGFKMPAIPAIKRLKGAGGK